MNLSEVAAKLVEAGLSRADTLSALDDLDLTVHPFDAALALECAWMREVTRDAGLSLADRACLTLAKRLSRPVLIDQPTRHCDSVRVSIPSMGNKKTLPGGFGITGQSSEPYCTFSAGIDSP